MQKNCLFICVIAILSILTVCLKTSFAAVSVPITISEAKPSDVAGLNRTNEPVTFGIPLKNSDSVAAISSLGLSGATLGQFRVLKRYPSGNIAWVLVDTQASVSAGATTSITLTSDGSGNFGGSNLASESGNIITVTTGSATFEIKKTNFNFIDKVTIGSTVVVDTADSVGIIANDGTFRVIKTQCR